VEIDLQPVRAERNLNPNVDLTGRSIPSHAPRRIISTDPLRDTTKRNPGSSVGTLAPDFRLEQFWWVITIGLWWD